jgi:site-specific DNA-methyltransferase (adenine-specific)
VKPYYSADGIVIYCADNRHVLPLLAQQDLLLTDPPYGIGFANQPTDYQRLNGQKREAWDNEPPESWVILLARTLCRVQIIWGGNYFALPVSRCWLSWYKPDAPPSMGDVEYAWTNLDQNSRQISQSISATNGERVGHPTQKPLRVMTWTLQQAGAVQTVLDPWMGSGTTLVAAKLLGRHAIGIELEERYAEIAANRLAQGVLPLHVNGQRKTVQETFPWL